MTIFRLGWMMCLAASLAACGGDEPPAADMASSPAAAPPTSQASAPAAAPAQPAPPSRPPGARTTSTPAPVPTAADSAAALREDVSPEWKMNQRNMAPYADCMAQATSVPEPARARLVAACGNLPDAPR
ncbi:MAG TPA: hypothetical protein VEQ60_32465 [Longimicrobium sp.]|nr:hypothetical protein [Longimicrobium sp.]